MRSRPRSNSSSSDGSLAKGNRVLIVATDNTMQRVPQYIGTVGIVREAPVHPCTWYKIKFDDGHIATFRPSALVGVEADYNLETGEGIIYRGGGSNHSSKHSSPEQVVAAAAKHVLTPVKQHVSNPKWLNELDGDEWVGAKVKITTGRMKGHEGTVLRSGNGWVQVETATYGEVAKRAHELELMSYDKTKITITIPKTIGSSPAPHTHTNNAHATHGVKRSLDAAMDEGSGGGVRTSSGRQVKPRSYSDADDEGSSTRGRSGNGRAQSYDSQGNQLTAPTAQKEPSAPLIHPNIKEARNQYMQKYVKKMTEKLKHRPDLMYWSHMLKASHVLSGGLPDPALESELARDFMDSVCSSCLKERWPAAKYCWNESCPSSPVYYKLTGCPPPSSSSAGPVIEGKMGNDTLDSSKKSVGDALGGEHTITINDDACPGDAGFSVYDHDRAVRARMHLSSPRESSVVDALVSLPSVILSAKGSTGMGGRKTNSSGVLVVETEKSNYKIPNSESARAMLMQKVVRESLTDSEDRVCGDNWSVPTDQGTGDVRVDEANDKGTNDGNAKPSPAQQSATATTVSISKVGPAVSTVPSGQTSGLAGKKSACSNMYPLPGLQLSGLPRMGQQDRERPPLLPSILPTTAPNIRLPGSTSMLLDSSVHSAVQSPSTALRVSPYLARGPGCFSFGAGGVDGPKSPTTRVA